MVLTTPDVVRTTYIAVCQTAPVQDLVFVVKGARCVVPMGVVRITVLSHVVTPKEIALLVISC